MASFPQSLPRLPSNLDVIVVRKKGANQTHRHFRVRRGVALQWLVTHNQYYRALGVTIDTTALAQLPQDGNVSQFVSVTEDCPSPDNPTAIDSPDMETEDDHDHLSQLLFHVAVPTMTEQEAVQQSVHQGSSHAALLWPSIGGMPLNEISNGGYFTCAGNYFKHLMQYDDGHFAQHPRFRSFALNTEMRHRALQTGRLYVRQYPGDAQLSLDELRDMVGRQGEAFSTFVLHYASSLRGTKQYWQCQRSRLLSMETLSRILRHGSKHFPSVCCHIL